jgi:hypothetical protein
MVRKSHWSFWPKRTKQLRGPAGVVMSIASEILRLRQNQFSSIKASLAFLEREKAAEDDEQAGPVAFFAF